MGLETALLIAGTATSAIGAIKQGQAASTSAKFNATRGRANAKGVLAADKESVRRKQRLARKAEGTRIVGGASMDLLEDSAMETKLQELTDTHSAKLKAIGFEGTAAADDLLADSSGGLGTAAATVLVGGQKAVASYKAGN